MAKSGAPLRGGTKMANWGVSEFDRTTGTLFIRFLPFGHFRLHHVREINRS
jgi:hypothetical protein